MRKLMFVSGLEISSSLALFGQHSSQPSAPPPQTARQALIEMIAGDQKAQFRHLTTEVQQEVSKPSGKGAAAYMASLSGMVKSAGTDLESFESGSVLFAVSDRKKKEKAEVVVDSDDLSGDQETFQLSVHLYRDGKEQDDEVMALSPKLSVEMKKQENIWRLNNLVVSINLPVGSPKLFQKMLQEKTTGPGLAAQAGAQVSDDTIPEKCCLDPQQIIQMIGYAELVYAREHPETGFTCSISGLADPNQTSGQLLDRSFTKGLANGNANGYRFTLSGCQGRPAGSYQIIAEPASPDAWPKAFCTDATQVIRSSDDGRGATCLTSGKPVRASQGDVGMQGGSVGFSVGSPASKPEK